MEPDARLVSVGRFMSSSQIGVDAISAELGYTSVATYSPREVTTYERE